MTSTKKATRVRHVMRRVQMLAPNAEAQVESDYKRYGVLCHRLGTMVLQNGLLATIAFLYADTRHSSGTKILLKHIFEGFRDAGHPLGGNTLSEKMSALCQVSEISYHAMTDEILELSVWHKRFAETILDVKQDENQNLKEERL